MPTPPFSAILLAAGRSTRMGRDKALLEIDDVPLWRRQRDVLAAAGAAEIFLSARPGQEWVRGTSGFTAVVHDALSAGGPIVGITAGLERATHPWLAVLAIDLPAMTPAWFTTLLREVENGVGMVGRRGEFFEPLAAIYPAQLRWLAWEALARGDFSLQHLLGAAVKQGLLRVREIEDDEAPLFENWNEPAPRGAD
jgi:molybdopterin-guanine dinucleotide biosynthesis protein A